MGGVKHPRGQLSTALLLVVVAAAVLFQNTMDFKAVSMFKAEKPELAAVPMLHMIEQAFQELPNLQVCSVTVLCSQVKMHQTDSVLGVELEPSNASAETCVTLKQKRLI